jgi:hypothetical protein
LWSLLHNGFDKQERQLQQAIESYRELRLLPDSCQKG